MRDNIVFHSNTTFIQVLYIWILDFHLPELCCDCDCEPGFVHVDGTVRSRTAHAGLMKTYRNVEHATNSAGWTSVAIAIMSITYHAMKKYTRGH